MQNVEKVKQTFFLNCLRFTGILRYQLRSQTLKISSGYVLNLLEFNEFFFTLRKKTAHFRMHHVLYKLCIKSGTVIVTPKYNESEWK